MNVVIFSKNRACQLELLLRSIRKFFKNYKHYTPCVLYKGTTKEYRAAYEVVKKEYGEFRFVPETCFARNLLKHVDKNHGRTVFFTDDNVFKETFDPKHPAIQRLAEDWDVLGFSLRLYSGISYCYTQNKKENKPALVENTWRWENAGGAWGSAMSLDGHIYRTFDLRPLLERLRYGCPNSLEIRLKRNAIPRPLMVCFDSAKIINIPWNKVQRRFANRCGKITAKVLNNEFLKGKRISLAPISGYQNRSVHELLPLVWL